MDEQPNNPRPSITPHRGQRVVRRAQPINDFGRPRPSQRYANPTVSPTVSAAPSSSAPQQPLPSQPYQHVPAQPAVNTPSPTDDIPSPVFAAPQTHNQTPLTVQDENLNPATIQSQTFNGAQVEDKPKKAKKPALPVGIYFVIASTFAAIIINFLRSSTFGDITSLLLILQSICALLLLTRKNFIRLGLFGVSILIIVVSIGLLVQTILAHQQIQNLESKYKQAASQIGTADLTTEQKDSLEKNQSEISDKRHQVGRDFAYAIAGQVVAVTLSGVVIWYVNRPKIKTVFK